jgi:nucleoside-diphosphate-sugar epimerase
VPLNLVSDEPFIHDVKLRVPDCSKAKNLLGYKAKTSLDDLLDAVIPWVTEQVKLGNI